MTDGPQARALEIATSRAGSFVYETARFLIHNILYRMFRLVSRGEEHLDTEGPLVIAPVHRSNLDAPLVAALAKRPYKSLAKESLFSPRPLGWLMSALGGFPVERGAADREALKAAQDLLDAGEAIIVFPEGTRQTGMQVGDAYDGPAFLAARTGAKVVPVGIAGTEAAMPPGAKFPRRSKVAIVVGEPIDPPDTGGKRLSLSKRREYTAELTARLQDVFDEAQIEAEQV